MLRIIALYLALVIPAVLLSQPDFVVFKGELRDQLTHESLPFVNIVWSGGQQGTVANENGLFHLKITENNKNDTLIFSLMGYESHSLPIVSIWPGKDHLQIALQPVTYQLSTVEVRPVNEEAVVRLAIYNIPVNYDMNPYRIKGYFREMGIQANTNRELLFAEGVVLAHKDKYHQQDRRKMEDFVSLIKGYRKKLNYTVEVGGTQFDLPQITQGAYSGVSLDLVRSPDFLLSKEQMRLYQYSFERMEILDGKEVYVLSFTPKEQELPPASEGKSITAYPLGDVVFSRPTPSSSNQEQDEEGWYQGELFIEKEEFAIVKIRYEPTARALKKFNKIISTNYLTLEQRQFEVDYFQYQGKWYLKSAIVKARYTETRSFVPIEMNMVFVTTSLETNIKWKGKAPDMLPQNGAFAFNEKLEKVEDDFWGADNILERSERAEVISTTVDSPTLPPNVPAGKDFVNKPGLSFRTNGLTSGLLVFSVQADQLGERPQIFALNPAITDTTLALQVKSPMIGILQYESVELPVFLHPDEKLVVNLTESPSNSLAIEFEGTGKVDNEFLLKYAEFQGSLLQNIQLAMEANDAVQYQKLVKVYGPACKQFIERKQSQTNISPELVNLLLIDLTYETARLLLTYPLLTGQLSEEDGLPEDFLAPVELVELNAPSALKLLNYQEFLKSYVFYKSSLLEIDDLKTASTILTQLEMADQYFMAEPLYFLQAFLLEQGFSFNLKGLDKEYRKFMKGDAPEALKGQVSKAFAEAKYPYFWNLLPPAALKDSQGNSFDSKVLEGKVVFVDFWATWCQPCLREMPFSNTLKKTFEKEKDLVFLYISLDKKLSHWQNFIEHKRLESPNTLHLVVNPDFFSQVQWGLGVSSIPRFMLLNRSGRLVNNDLPFPSRGMSEPFIREELGRQ